MTVIFFDLSSTIPGKAFAPNPFKTRYALAYKQIPFVTEWCEFIDLPDKMKAAGAPPNSVAPDGTKKYLVPTIIDESTGKGVSESMVIAEYLDETYPDKPVLFPSGSISSIKEFEQLWHKEVHPVYMPIMVPWVYKLINPASQPYFRETREKIFGCKIEEICPEEKRPQQFQKLEVALSKMAAEYDKSGKDTPFFLGDTFSYADCIAGGWLQWARRLLGPEEWAIIAGFNDGRWGRLVEFCDGLGGNN